MRPIASLALAAILATPAASAVGQAAPALDPARAAKIDRWVNDLITRQRIPGATALVVHDGRVVYERAWGVRDVDSKVPLKPNDLFRIASQTKAITSVAVMMLWEEGRFGLDEPVGNYLPAFKEHTILTKFNPADSSYETKPTRRRITIRQLLTHTSGLDYADIGSDEFKAIYAKAGITAWGKEGASLAADIDKLATLPLKHEPGERFTYSLSIDVLGRLVEVVSGQTLEQFFAERIFGPLKMTDTYFRVPAEKASRLVAMHQDTAGTLRAMREPRGWANPNYPVRPMTYFSGGAGLTSTTRDYARFLQMVLNGGSLDGVRLLGRKTVEMMLTNQTGTLNNFGLGFGLETAQNDFRQPLSLGSFEWGGAFRTTYWADPKERLVALIYTNTFGGTLDFGGPFKTLVYAALR
ncbi:MAG: serine hydrolase domain-containing protein [Gemmatimonadaceae bacterium]|nr:serine hydrolase domain-containing protein [Gemmatimonadaceae bacterium]